MTTLAYHFQLAIAETVGTPQRGKHGCRSQTAVQRAGQTRAWFPAVQHRTPRGAIPGTRFEVDDCKPALSSLHITFSPCTPAPEELR